jgi:glyceraldehyde-3-phosphate dehydrogenase/erythrose-4-phosphate dehydrogenase
MAVCKSAVEEQESGEMSVRVAINGFGRIGRNILRAIVEAERSDIEVVAVNDLAPVETNAHLLRYDSIHGRFPAQVTVKGDTISCGNGTIKVTALKDPTQLPWKDLGVDVALECTGIFTSKDKAAAHLKAGAKRVLVSAPADGVDLTVVYGVNHANEEPYGCLERLVHDQLSGAGRQSAQRCSRYRQGIYDDGALLHQRPAVARSGA